MPPKILAVLENGWLELRFALPRQHARRPVRFGGTTPETYDGQRLQSATGAFGVILDVPFFEVSIHGCGERQAVEASTIHFDEQLVSAVLLVRDHQKKGRLETQRSRTLLHRRNRLRLVELLAGQIGHALPLLDEAQERRFVEAPFHAEKVVHEVTVQARRRGDDDVILASLLQLIEREAGAVASIPGVLLNEFEEVVMLAVGILYDNAYGVSIKKEIEQRLKRTVSVGALQSALRRLESKGYLKTREGEETQERAGRPKCYFSITALGKRALEYTRSTRDEMWQAIPEVALNPQQRRLA